jgi:hypothetical protein
MTMTDTDLTEADSLRELATADEVALPGKRCTVTFADRSTIEVRITNHCYIAWDKTAPRKKWGAMADVPFLAGTFMAWIAAKRAGLTELGWEAWQDAVEDITNLAEEPEDLARPTQRAAQPGTS